MPETYAEVVIHIESFIINEDGAWVHLTTKPGTHAFISPLKPGDELRIKLNPMPVFTVRRKDEEKEIDE